MSAGWPKVNDEALMKVQIKWLSWVVVLRPMTDLQDDPVLDELAAAFKSAWANSYQGVVVNLSEVNRLSSSGFGVLLQFATDAKRTGTKIAFCRVSRSVDRLLATASMRLPNSFQSEEDAIRFCSER